MLIISVMLSVAIYAQVGVGLKESTIRQSIKVNEKVTTENFQDGTKLLRITNEFYMRGYFITNDICFMYVVRPLDNEACDAFLDVCNKTYTYLGDEKWKSLINGKNLIITRIFNKDINEHMYVYVDENDEKNL